MRATVSPCTYSTASCSRARHASISSAPSIGRWRPVIRRRGAVLRQPHHTAVDGLAAGRGMELELEVAHAQSEPRLEREVRHRAVLAERLARIAARELA